MDDSNSHLGLSTHFLGITVIGCILFRTILGNLNILDLTHA